MAYFSQCVDCNKKFKVPNDHHSSLRCKPCYKVALKDGTAWISKSESDRLKSLKIIS